MALDAAVEVKCGRCGIRFFFWGEILEVLFFSLGRFHVFVFWDSWDSWDN